MNDSSNILERIVARKVDEIAERRELHNLADLEVAARSQEGPRGFADAITAALITGKAAVIAEVKKASPSKGVIRPDFNPEMIAASYARHGATCLSVLTDVDFFQGKNEFLTGARVPGGITRVGDHRKQFGLVIEATAVEVLGIGGMKIIIRCHSDSFPIAARLRQDI